MFNLSYQDVDDVVVTNGTAVSAAEAHGALTGMLCVDRMMANGRWLDTLFGDDKDALPEGDRVMLKELGDQTQQLLIEMDFSFELLLPDDDSSLKERAQALSEWCQGFLHVLGERAGGHVWAGECSEVLSDLREIAELDSDADGEVDEEAYVEILEFVRVGVQLIYSEFQRQNYPMRLH